MIRCKTDRGGVLVPVHAQPGASRSRIGGEYEGAIRIAVPQPPQGGRANAAIAKVLAEALGVRKSAVRLVSGRTSRNKVFRVNGVSEGQVGRLLDERTT